MMSLLALHSDLLGCIFAFFTPGDKALARFVCARFRSLISPPKRVKHIRYDTNPERPMCNYYDRVGAQHYVGDIKLFRWAIQNKCPCGNGIISAAVTHNNREVIEYIHQTFPEIARRPVDAHVCAFHGHLELLQWMVTQGYPDSSYMGYAAAGGHRNILEWGLSRGQQLDQYVCAGTMISGSIDTLEWVLQHNKKGIRWLVDERQLAIFSINAAEHRHYHMLEWLSRNGCPIEDYIVTVAASRGDLKMLQWAKDHGCDMSSFAYVKAAECGHLDVIRWLLANNVVAYGEAVSQAGQTKQYDAMHLLLQHGVEVNIDDIWHMVKYGSVEALQIIHQYIPFTPERRQYCRSFAQELDKPMVIEWLDQLK